MSLPIYQRVAVTDAGDVIPGAEYTVINENTGVAAPIYSDRTGATLLTPPYFADSVGTIQFFIAQGTTFRVAASGGVGTYTDRYVYGVAEAVLVQAGGTVNIGGLGSNDGNIALKRSYDDLTVGNVTVDSVGSRFVVGTAYSNIDFVTEQTNFGMRINNGNVGIGTISPSSYYSDNLVVMTPNEGGITIASDSVSGGAYLAFADGTVGNAAYRGFINYSHGSDFMRFATGALERLRIDSSGNLALGSTNAYSHRFFARGSGANETVGLAVGANDTNVIRFYSSTLGTAGAIRVSAAGTSVAYNTSSDYRLKEDDVAMTGATERVKALRPVNFAWKVDGSRVDGFFAHELAEIVPEAATGTKDAMRDEEYEITPAVYEDVTIPAVEAVLDEAGVVITEAVEESTESVLVTEAVMGTRSVPDYQGIDQSKLVPLLTATIQELIARIEALEAGV